MPIANFTIAELPDDEVERLAALRALNVLDTAPSPELDAVATEASAAFGTAMVFISLVDRDRQWFKAKVGSDAASTPRSVSFCAHALHSDDILEVVDTSMDSRFAGNPSVVDEPRILYYAGAPLVTSDGYRIGTLCIADDRTRRALAPIERARLYSLASKAVEIMEGCQVRTS